VRAEDYIYRLAPDLRLPAMGLPHEMMDGEAVLRHKKSEMNER
jgi:hypothetical protein